MSRVFANLFPLWGGKDALPFSMIPEADFVCWELDLSKPTQSTIPDPEVVVDVASDFPRIDERRMGRHYNIIYLPVVVPDLPPNGFPMPVSLKALSKVDKKAKIIEYYKPGDDCLVEEPIFIPRNKDSAEGDGWVLSMIKRVKQRRSDLVVLDSKDFSKPIAIIQMPLYLRNQVHRNWVEAFEHTTAARPFTRVFKTDKVSGRGALEEEWCSMTTLRNSLSNYSVV